MKLCSNQSKGDRKSRLVRVKSALSLNALNPLNESVLKPPEKTNLLYLTMSKIYLPSQLLNTDGFDFITGLQPLFIDLRRRHPNTIYTLLAHMASEFTRFSYWLVDYLSKRNITTPASCLSSFSFFLCFHCAKAFRPIFNPSVSCLSFIFGFFARLR